MDVPCLDPPFLGERDTSETFRPKYIDFVLVARGDTGTLPVTFRWGTLLVKVRENG